MVSRIFVAVGTQLPFDRLVKTIDFWAGESGRAGIFAQVANGGYVPRHLESSPFVTPREFRRRTEEADVVIAHAGMGTIITALELGRPVLVMPRLARLREQRNDHQVASARAFLKHGRIAVAWDEHELRARLEAIDDFVAAGEAIAKEASPGLVSVIRDFLEGRPDPALLSTRAREHGSPRFRWGWRMGSPISLLRQKIL